MGLLKELRRKGVHLFSLLVVLSLYLFGKEITHMFLVLITAMALLIELARIDWRIKIALEELLRRKEKKALTGATHFLLGATITVSILPVKYATVTILFVTFGDLAAAIIGKLGRTEFLRGKKVEGVLAELIVDVAIALVFAGPIAVPAAFIATMVETLSSRTDDNLLISVICTAYFVVIKWLGLFA